MTPNLSLVIEFSSPVHCHNWYLCFCFLSLFGGFRIICRSRFCLSFAPCRDLKMHSLFLFYCHLALRLRQYIYTVNMPVGNYKAYCHWPRSVFPQHQCQERNSSSFPLSHLISPGAVSSMSLLSPPDAVHISRGVLLDRESGSASRGWPEET